MSDLKKRSELRKKKIKEELAKLKAFKAKCKQKLTVARLKTMKGFENLSDEMAERVIQQLQEYAQIVLRQMNRLNQLKKERI